MEEAALATAIEEPELVVVEGDVAIAVVFFFFFVTVEATAAVTGLAALHNNNHAQDQEFWV